VISHPFTWTRQMPALVAALMLGAAGPALAFSLPLPTGIGVSEAPPERLHVAQATPETAQLAVRIQQLEEQVRVLNGQIDGLTFQLTQMQTLLERMTQETNMRFEALEGGAPASAPAAPAGSAPQDPADVPQTIIPEQGVRPLPGEAEVDPTFEGDAGEIGNSNDPLIGTGGGAAGADLATGQPLDLSFDPNAEPSGNADADAQFAAAREAISKGDNAFAEEQLQQFLELYPDNPLVPDAASLLGDVLMQRSAYDDAAEVLLDAFQKSPDSPRAPDLLLKLGMSLAGVGETDTACRTFAEVDRRFSDLPDDFLNRLGAEKTRAECPSA